MQPRVKEGLYKDVKAEEWSEFNNPLVIETEPATNLQFKWTMKHNALKPKQYTVIPDDCLESLVINGVQYTEIEYPICNWDHGVQIDISDYVQSGSNTFFAEVHNIGGKSGLKIALPSLYWLNVLIHSLFYCLIAVILLLLMRSYFSLASIFAAIVAVLLRIYYYSTTPFFRRGHDVWDHIAYIKDISERLLDLPAANEGFVHYHPPIYHFSAGVLLRFVEILKFTEHSAMRLLQMQTLIYALCIWACILVISKILFSDRSTVSRNVFIWLCAPFTGLVFFTGRINNDVLVMVWQFMFLALLLHWWNTQNIKHFFWSIIIICLAILTKTNSLLLLAIAFTCLVLCSLPWRKKIIVGLYSCLLVLVATGWFFIIRFVIEQSPHIVGNIERMSSGYLLSQDLKNLFEFNPFRLVQVPYIHPYILITTGSYFWEILWATAFFGEFDHGEDLKNLSSVIIFCSQVLALYCVRGVYITVKNHFRKYIPLITTLIVLLSGHIAFVRISPYVPSQDFRYSMLLLVPIAFFITQGIKTSNQLFRNIAYLALIVITISQIWFIIQLGL